MYAHEQTVRFLKHHSRLHSAQSSYLPQALPMATCDSAANLGKMTPDNRSRLMTEQDANNELHRDDKSQSSQGRSLNSAQPAAPGDILSKAGSEGPRRSLVHNFISSIKFIKEAHSGPAAVSLRKGDQISQFLLIGSILIIISAQFMHDGHMTVTALADTLMAAALLFFLVSRFGILQTLLPRPALIIWQLIVGRFLF